MINYGATEEERNLRSPRRQGADRGLPIARTRQDTCQCYLPVPVTSDHAPCSESLSVFQFQLISNNLQCLRSVVISDITFQCQVVSAKSLGPTCANLCIIDYACSMSVRVCEPGGHARLVLLPCECARPFTVRYGLWSSSTLFVCSPSFLPSQFQSFNCQTTHDFLHSWFTHRTMVPERKHESPSPNRPGIGN